MGNHSSTFRLVHFMDSSIQKRPRANRNGVTLIEMMVALAIVTILVSVAVPEFAAWRNADRVRTAARSIADAFHMARSEAIRTKDRHIIFFSAGAGIDTAPAGLDTASQPILDDVGNPVPILVINDEASAASNCRIDAGEHVEAWAAQPGALWGKTSPGDTDRAPDDRPGAGSATIPARGVAFYAPNGTTRVTWVAFSPDGVPISFDASCNVGRIGTGGGTVYVTGAGRDYAVTLSPLGGVRVHGWVGGSSSWTQ